MLVTSTDLSLNVERVLKTSYSDNLIIIYVMDKIYLTFAFLGCNFTLKDTISREGKKQA